MRILVAALIGGLLMFVWGALAHMALPLGEWSMGTPRDEAALLASLKQNLPAASGIYVLPHFDPAMQANDQALKAFSAKSLASPYAFVVYDPQGRDSLAMGRNLALQWLSDTLAALLVALVLGRGAGLRRGLGVGLAFGVFSWLSLSVPYWNWYRFPTGFTVAALVEQVVGWLLAGAVMGWWLGRNRRRALMR